MKTNLSVILVVILSVVVIFVVGEPDEPEYGINKSKYTIAYVACTSRKTSKPFSCKDYATQLATTCIAGCK